ncbi:PREDICTED: basic blue protein-like [Ipomoea nil]|uniref:basic blue protein-like n=1 Tax=Ipomoea nil TaxID=35883 RepID=UPI0009010191|nr:PREDICTED: basic blue protein-like [Ipomoea nil]
MASTIFFFLTVAILAVYVTATDYIVGDEYGWTTNVDYQAWAQGKQFVVGDRLIFKYQAGTNSVYKVGGSGFKQCIPPAQSTPLTTGNDVIELGTPGRKWYISGTGQYCKLGQKLVITVSAKPQAPSPSPATWPRKMLPAPVSPPWPIIFPPIPAPVPATPYWPLPIVLPPSPAPAPDTPNWPLPIPFPPSPAPAPAIPYFPLPFPPFPFPVPVPAPNQGGY